jgi:hypothetical protein
MFCGLIQVSLQEEVPSVQEVDFGARSVVGEGDRTSRSEDLVVAPPDGKHGDFTFAQVGMKLRVERGVGGVVAKELQLDQVVADPG